MTKLFLHVEGLAVFLLSVYAYSYNDFSWLVFLLLLLAPDLSMAGYMISSKAGAVIYNLFHTYTVPAAAVIAGLIVSSPVVLAGGLIWAAHIGMDRMFGFGLKYGTGFKDTHLDRV
ncbi:hypothetical protein CR205_12865 [Alteribacter lacisalsi]|uniref:DUF4260 family protein n=1 Tax=Alteribacter lacisalsi TaxID=2045244 RepID=A0A2W0H7B5_9BACI|nr:DUF4260 domain-containing protein [Alteribacter lacisalsi]PYZ97007.1 hypothetical protein CR205_12865 [Alteribacter lacisalsi]